MTSFKDWLFDENPMPIADFFKQFVAKMKEAGATGQIRFNFDGSGDSGTVSYPDLTSDQHSSLLKVVAAVISKPDPSTMDVAEFVQDLENKVDDLLPSGWELDDGAYGTFVLDLDNQQVYIDYNEQYMTSEYRRIDF